MYLPKVPKKKNHKRANQVLPKLGQPKKQREIVEANPLPVFSDRRLSAKHRKKPISKNLAKVVPSVDVALELQSEKVLEVFTEKKAEAIATKPPEVVVEELEVVAEVVEVEDTPEEEHLDLSSLTKKQLISVAQKEKVVYKNLTKAELLEALTIVMG